MKGATMKKFAVGMILALVVCALAGTAAQAKVKSKTVSIAVDFVVGNTMVKKGTYKFSFDTVSNELTVMAKDKTVVAKTAARLENRQKDASALDIVLAQKGDTQMLVSIAFAGDSQNIVVQSDAVQTASHR
jgi:polyisoprenoid-binding protein YceI